MIPFICSGREVGDIQAILKEADLAIPAVGLNGAIGYDQDKLIFDFPFDPQAVKRSEPDRFSVSNKNIYQSRQL